MIESSVIYESSDFAVINKPAGLLVHHMHFWTQGERRHSREFEPALTDWLLEKYPETASVGDVPESRPGIVHRLDRDTSGAMIVARTQESFLYFKKLFKEQRVKKIYLALVWGEVSPPSGVIDKPIGIAGKSLKRSVGGVDLKKSAPAVTEYRVLKTIGNPSTSLPAGRQGSGSNIFSLLEVSPRTGRTHQIRVHLSSIGHPVVGDKLYGVIANIANLPKQNNANIGRQMLHAVSLEFDSPSGPHLKIEAPLPEDMTKFDFK